MAADHDAPERVAAGPYRTVHGRHLRLRQLPAAIRAGVELARAYRRQGDSTDDAPRTVMLNDRSRKLARRARELARQGREDPDAVADLANITGRHDRDLRIARLDFQRDGRHREVQVDNRAHRLLSAVRSGPPVTAVTAEDLHRIQMLEHFTAQPTDAQFNQLAALEPELASLAEQLEADQPAQSLPPPQSTDRSPAPNREKLARLHELRARLKLLVGPAATRDDPLLRSHIAADVAHTFLLRRLVPPADRR